MERVYGKAGHLGRVQKRGESMQGCDEEGQGSPGIEAGKGCQKQQEGLLQLHSTKWKTRDCETVYLTFPAEAVNDCSPSAGLCLGRSSVSDMGLIQPKGTGGFGTLSLPTALWRCLLVLFPADLRAQPVSSSTQCNCPLSASGGVCIPGFLWDGCGRSARDSEKTSD